MRRKNHATKALLLSVIAAIAFGSASAQPAAAATRTIGYWPALKNGDCKPQLNGDLRISSPAFTVYGVSPTPDWVHIWYRLVDDHGNAQSQWGDAGWGTASTSSPLTMGTITIFRPSLYAYSRIIIDLQWYRNGTPVGEDARVLDHYDGYTYIPAPGNLLPILSKVTGTFTACYA